MQASYTYDAFGNRIGMSVTQSSSTTITHSSFEALDPPQVGADLTNWQLADDLNSSNVVQVHYVGGSQTNQWVAQVVAGSGVRWDLTDQLGSIRLVTNASGA